MKILIFSDSHGKEAYIRAALTAHRGTTDAVYFLGDGIRDIAAVLADFSEIPAVVLTGNCDSALTVSVCGIHAVEEDVRVLDGMRILAMHGHTAQVKWGYDRLLYRASEVGADIALFRHTHLPENSFHPAVGDAERRILLFNPGSVGQGIDHTYGVIYLVGGQISAAHGYAQI